MKKNSRRSLPSSENDGVLLTESDVKEIWNFYEFARTLSGSNGIYPGIYNPLLVNQRLMDISMNPKVPTDETLSNALADPKNNEQQLQEFSESFENTSQPYKRLLSFLATSLSWNISYTCINVKKKEEYLGKKYQADLYAIESELDRFDFEKEFAIVVKEMMRNEAYFCSPRFDGQRIVLQELPSSPVYTKITGRCDYCPLFDFNLNWFLQPGTNLDMYDPFFAKSFQKFWGDSKQTSSIAEYNPAILPELRGNSSWVYWQQVPITKGWCWKFSPETVARLPYFTPLFSDLILQPLMRSLQKNINMAAAHKILAGQVPMLQNNSGPKVKDQLAMSPETLAKFLQLVSSSLNSAIKVVSAPLDNIQGISFDGNNELYPEYLRNTLAASGVNTNLIFTSNTKPNQMESQLSLNADENILTSLYSQFALFMDYHMNKVAKNGYRWKFNFSGTNFFTSRAEKLDVQLKMMANGIVLPHQIAGAIGLRPADMKRQMEEAAATGFVDKLTPIIQAAQMSNKEGGRPRSDANNLSESAAQTRDSGGNRDKGGKI